MIFPTTPDAQLKELCNSDDLCDPIIFHCLEITGYSYMLWFYH